MLTFLGQMFEEGFSLPFSILLQERMDVLMNLGNLTFAHRFGDDLLRRRKPRAFGAAG